MIEVGLVLVLAYAFYCCWINIPARTGYQICNNVSGELRSVGPGLHLLIPFLESKVEPAISLKTNSHTLEIIFATKDEAGVRLTLTFEEAADPDHLVAYSSFEEGKRISDIIERIKAILDGEIRPMKNRDDVMDCLKIIADMAGLDFKNTSENGKSLEKHFGTKLLSLELFPAALPEDVVKAKAEQEAQEKRNQTQKMQADNFRRMASDIVKEAKKHGQTISTEKAYRMVQLEFGKGNLKEEIKTYGIEQGSQEMLEKIVKGVIELCLPKAK